MRLVHRQTVLVLLAAVLLQASAAAAAGGEARDGGVAGVVVSAVTQRPVASAIVSVEGTTLHTTTDDEGRFRIASIPEGTYSLVIERDGFLPALASGVVVLPAHDTPLDLRLQDQARREEHITVAPSPFEKVPGLTNSTIALSHDELRRAPGALRDIGRMVQAMPGVGARDDQRNDIVARGGSPSENLTLVDGVEVTNLNHFGGQGTSGGPITMLNAGLVSDARFLAGGFPAEYGNRLSSVLEIDLREGSREKFQTELDLGMSGAGAVLEGPIGSNGSWLFSGRRSYLDLIAGAYGLTSVPAYANYQGKAVYDVTPRNRLSLLSLGGWDSIESTYDPEELDKPDTFFGTLHGWRTVTGAAWRGLFGRGGVATLAASHSTNHYAAEMFDERHAGALVQWNRSSERETTVRGELVFGVTGGSVKIGGSAKRIGQDLDIDMPIGVENPFSTAHDARLDVTHINEHLTTWQPAAYAQVSERLGSAMTLNLGARSDRFAVTHEQAWSPNAGLVVRLARNLDLSASVGRYHQSPPLLFFESSPENAELRPIRADHAVGGLEMRLARDVRVSLEVYGKRYASYPVSLELPFLTFADTGTQYDVSYLLQPLASKGNGRSQGCELFVQKKVGGRLWGQASYALARSEQQALDGHWRRGTYDLPHVLSVVAGTQLTSRLEVSSKFTYTSGRPMTPLLEEESLAQNRMVLDAARYNALRTPAYHRLDLRIDHRTSHRWGTLTSYVELDNLYDRHNVREIYWNAKTHEQYDIPQISFLAIGGLTLRF